MRIPAELLILLDAQITHERTNAAIYAQMASFLDARSLVYLACYMQSQAKGEQFHADKLVNYLSDRDDYATFGNIPAPELSPTISAAEYFTVALSVERSTTYGVVELYRVARAMDPQTEVFLHWYLIEQVEEENVVGEICDRFLRSANLGDEWMDNFVRENFDRLTGK